MKKLAITAVPLLLLPPECATGARRMATTSSDSLSRRTDSAQSALGYPMSRCAPSNPKDSR